VEASEKDQTIAPARFEPRTYSLRLSHYIQRAIPAAHSYSWSQWPAALSKAWVCSRSLDVIVGSNPAGSMDVCLV